jgi:hypothetical protein
MWNNCKSTVFLDYIHNTLYIVATHIKAFHISENNLPVLTDDYNKYVLPSGVPLVTNLPSGIPLVRHRGNKEIKDVMKATVASAA